MSRGQESVEPRGLSRGPCRRVYKSPGSGISRASFWAKWWLECATPWRSTLEKKKQSRRWSEAALFIFFISQMCVYSTDTRCFRYLRKINSVSQVCAFSLTERNSLCGSWPLKINEWIKVCWDDSYPSISFIQVTSVFIDSVRCADIWILFLQDTIARPECLWDRCE